MKFKEYVNSVEDKNFVIVENFENDSLVSYNVTYKFGGKTLTEDVNVSGLSKKSTKKRLEDTKNKMKSSVRLVLEGTVTPNPGTDIIRNDLGQILLPHGFTSDCTLLTPQEISDTAIHMARYEAEKISKYINQISDDIATVEKLGQMNRVADLKIRLAIAKMALQMSDIRGEFRS